MLLVDGGIPIAIKSAEWVTRRGYIPGEFKFSMIWDGCSRIREGSRVVYTHLGGPVFQGFAFKLSSTEDKIVDVTCYDQLRYFKNKDSYVYKDKKASDLLKMLCGDFGLRTGLVEDTGYVIKSRIEDNQTLFDMMGNAIDLTLQYTRRLFVLYDDFGGVCLRDIRNMKLPVVITRCNTGKYDWSSEIDTKTYNKIKLFKPDHGKGNREVVVREDPATEAMWGILQLTGTVAENEDPKAKAASLLRLHNKPTKKLKMKNVEGNPAVRAGSSVLVAMSFLGETVYQYMLVEEARHKFEANAHTMDLTLKGGRFEK